MEIENIIVLGLGSNVGHGPERIRTALAHLGQSGVSVEAVSAMYATSPVGPQDQPDFTNACVRARTGLPPNALLALCKDIEARMGRTETERWGPREIDIDILLYAGFRINGPGLTIPHAEMGNRLFVLVPLLDVCEGLAMPDGKPVKDFAQHRIKDLENSDQKIRKIDE